MTMLTRDKTKKIRIGTVFLGGQDKVLIQSMCNIKTEKTDAVIKQIRRCVKLGADLMRVSVLDEKDALALKKICALSQVPIIADIHFDHRLALLAIENGVAAIRLNPGNIGGKENIRRVVTACIKNHVAIRIGVNSGSIDKDLARTGQVTAKDLVTSAARMAALLEELDFHDIVISLKGSDVRETVKAYHLAARTFSYPLHLGITEAGPKDVGLIRSAAGLAPLLLCGIGDTIRISLSDQPEEEILAAKRLLKDLGLISDFPTLISCPTCGRTAVDLLPLAKRVRVFLEEERIPLTVAVMGCIVNGPGEASRADIGVAGAKGVWVMFKKGVRYKTVAEKDVYEELTAEIRKMTAVKADLKE